ncbi:MAG: ABC transporter ATP-binding protein [Bacilli bacterium]|nr:ABC transporter ATP-binding protein [Bacilli bacterium]MBN2876169.1 ABC transporter ATP-binding protein [Bacilli bacterium]
MDDKIILKRLLKYASPYKFRFLAVLSLMIITVAAGLLEPFIIGQSIDILSADTFDSHLLTTYLVIYGSSIIITAIVTYFQVLMLQRIGQTILYNIREEVFNHIEMQDIEYHNKKPTGTLVTRVTNDTNTLNEMFTSVIVNVIRNVLMLIGIIAAMAILNYRQVGNVNLTLTVMVIMPFVLVASFIFRKYSRKAYREVRKNLAKVNAFLSEHLSGMKIIQIFNQEKRKYQEFHDRNNDLRKSYMKQIFIFGIYRPTVYLFYIGTLIIIYYFGGLQAINGVITVGFLVAFVQYISRFFDPIQQLAEQFNVLQAAFAASERIFGILDEQPKVVDSDDAIALDHIKGDIEFRNVWFAYIEEEWILKDVSFKVKAKDSVAFVGATGAGKTTILSLIVRNYDIQKGQILIDGIDIKKIKISSLRSFIGQMLQEVFLFSGTIASNIKLRENSITDQEMVEASKYVNADRFIDRLDDKYQEEVRERGNNFSSGQRQLLSFSRTLVHKPSVMILDEATANIDTETEQLIQDSLTKMMTIGTMLIVAHRLSTIQHVDQIIVLHKGEIIERGSHQDLLKQKGMYYDLYKLQYQDIQTQ